MSRLLIGLTVVMVSLGNATAQKRWKDDELGCSLSTIKGWEQMPVEPTERYTVAKWASPRDIRDFPCRVLVYAFEPRIKKEKGEKPAGGYGRETAWGPKHSFRSFVNNSFRRQAMKLGKPKKLKIKQVKGTAKVKAEYYQGTRDSGYTLGGKPLGNYYWLVATYTTDKRQFAVEMFCGEVSKRKLKPVFMKIAKSFKLLGADNGQGTTGPKEKLTPREEARKRAEKNSKVEGWWYEESQHYIIVTNVPKKDKAKILRIKRQLEAMRALYEEDFPPAKPIEAISIVRICKDRQTYVNYGGSPSTAGYWFAYAKELVLYVEGYFRFVLGVLNHEAFHQYIHYACGEISPHTWFNEGTGEYYYGTQLVGKKGIINVCKPRVDIIKSHVRAKTHVPLDKFIRYTQGQYYSDASRCYAQGWALVDYMRRGIRKGHPWAGVYRKYFDTLVKTGDRKKALDTAFADVDIKEFEKRWREYVAKGRKTG